jgi:hypothetical protein
MGVRLRSRLTFANLIALLALFITLGSGVYAASKIHGSQFKRESIPGNRLKSDAVTGATLSESSLGKVPSAASADTAQTAQFVSAAPTAESADHALTVESAARATILGGIRFDEFLSSGHLKQQRFDATIPSGGPAETRTVLELAPLSLTAKCDNAVGLADFDIQAATSAPDGRIDAGFTIELAGNQTAGTDGRDVGATPATVLGFGVQNDFIRAVGDIVYSDAQTTISIPFVLVFHDASGAAPENARCFFTATATRATG